MTFTEIFGNSPRVRLLDFLADHIDFDYNISQMSELADVARPTVYGLVEELTRDGMLELTREMGDSRLYRLNQKDPKVISMLQMDFQRLNKELMVAEYAASARAPEARAIPRRILSSMMPAGKAARVAGYMSAPRHPKKGKKRH